jgi:hypothetical protein
VAALVVGVQAVPGQYRRGNFGTQSAENHRDGLAVDLDIVAINSAPASDVGYALRPSNDVPPQALKLLGQDHP